MTADERKWTAVLLFIVTFVLAIPALFGLVDAWLYAMRLPVVWAWDDGRVAAVWGCFSGAWIFFGAGIGVWPKR